MMYENTRDGIIEEYTDKLCDEAGNGSYRQPAERNLQKHFIHGLVCDIVDRIEELKNDNSTSD